jgi:hypothetical protein
MPGSKPNLPPASQPWGREVDRDRADYANRLRRLEDNVGTTLQQLSSTIGNLSSQIASLSKQRSYGVEIASFNSGAIPSDSVVHWLTNTPALTVDVELPAGHGIITVGCGRAFVTPGAGAGEAYVSFSAVRLVDNKTHIGVGDDFSTLRVSGSATLVGAGLVRVAMLDVNPGTYRFTGRFGVWANSTGASAQFDNPYMSVQVTG